MNTLVIIPAYNAAEHIASTLDAMPPAADVIVAVNGSTDATADIVKDFPAVTLEVFPQPSKTRAFQATLRGLGDRALDPLILLDADTKPLRPAAWLTSMTAALTAPGRLEAPQAVGGPVYYYGNNVLGPVRSLYRVAQAVRLSRQGATLDSIDTDAGRGAQYAPNLGLRLHDRETLQDILNLPDYWLGEDRALVATVLNRGGHFAQQLNPAAICRSPLSGTYPTTRQALRLGFSGVRRQVKANYASSGSPGSEVFTRLK